MSEREKDIFFCLVSAWTNWMCCVVCGVQSVRIHLKAAKGVSLALIPSSHEDLSTHPRPRSPAHVHTHTCATNPSRIGRMNGAFPARELATAFGALDPDEHCEPVVPPPHSELDFVIEPERENLFWGSFSCCKRPANFKVQHLKWLTKRFPNGSQNQPSKSQASACKANSCARTKQVHVQHGCVGLAQGG